MVSSKSNNEMIKRLALLEELETSIKLIKLGFGELQNLTFVNDFYFLPLQLLSQGFERLMKAYLCIGHLSKHGVYPHVNDILTHDLEVLLRKILTDYFSNEDKPILIQDEAFLTEDENVHKLLYIMSEFGKKARYYNFDVITDNSKIGVDAKKLWSEYEDEYVIENDLTHKLVNPDLENEVFGDISRHIITVLERFVSALSRQFTLGAINKEERQMSVTVYDFITLFPDDLGKTNYQKDTTSYKSVERSVHTRTQEDEIERAKNPNFKSKKIRRSEYTKEWPFLADEVIIECRDKYWCVVTIDNKDYALNGSAKGRYKLESPHEAGMAIKGVSIGDFITMALELAK